MGGEHLAAKRTKKRLKLSFTWPTIAADVTHACQVCDECQNADVLLSKVSMTEYPCICVQIMLVPYVLWIRKLRCIRPYLDS